MSYEVLTTDEFLKDVKSIIKIYPGFKHDIQNTILLLQENPEQGDHLGHGLYKLRISITGKSSGKSYGARVNPRSHFRTQKSFSMKSLR